MNTRLKQFLAAENISQAQFADSINVVRASVSHVLSGRNNPSFDFIKAMMQQYPNLNIDWLMFGKGRMYKDAARLAQDLKNGHKDAISEDARDETVEMQHQNKSDDSNKKEYSGPSVVSYTLDGRKASHLKIPAYRCYGAGDVTVIITVNNAGQVVGAKVMDSISSSDQCLRNFAVRAARLSRFSASQTAPPNQTGEIVYRFIAQQ